MNAPVPGSTITLQRALLGTLAVAMLAGFIPASIVLDRRLAAVLEDRARTDLAVAPRVLADRMASTSDAMMMHAKEVAQLPGLADALVAGDRASALRRVAAARSALSGNEPVLVASDGVNWYGPAIDSAIVAQTREGRMPVVTQSVGGMIRRVALAPVLRSGQWVGAAGLVTPFDDRAAEMLAGLTRSGVVIITPENQFTGTTLDTMTTLALLDAQRNRVLDSVPRLVSTARARYLAATAPLAGAGVVLFARSMDAELSVLPGLRRMAGVAAVGALSVALLLGAVLAARVGRPVRELAAAASALGEERFTALLPTSRIREVSRVSATFDVMRRTLAARMEELRGANESLSDRNAKLTALQSDLMQRDRLAATGRLVVQLAHEIRNPVASLRNCLELIRRRVDHDPEASEFADLAIDELLRMHELAEQMLDLNRPQGSGARACQPLSVAREVARLVNLGTDPARYRIIAVGDATLVAAIAPDALKQVLLNTVQNAREALLTMPPPRAAGTIEIIVAPHQGGVAIEVNDDGPGIADEIAARLFDPFFTTKDAVHGVGLGLFVAEGLVRSAGGRMTASNRAEGGAHFRIELPKGEATMPVASADVI